MQTISRGNYLVAGATGLMGTTALLRLKDVTGVHVRAVYHTRKPKILADNISYIKADLRDLDECRKAVEGIDHLLMFAAVLSTAPMMARDPVSHVTSTLIMNARMLQAAYFARVKKFLWLSSSTGYPLKERPLSEDDMFAGDPPDSYFSVGWMSRYAETLCRMYATKLKNPMRIVVLRPTTIYGEHEDFHFETCHMLPALVRKVSERQRPIEVWGTGDNRRDLIYADDMFDACLSALETAEQYDVFNVGFGKQYSVNELLKLIIEIDGFTGAEVIHDTSKPTAIFARETDCTKAKKVLGFEPKTSIEEGIAKMLRWYKEHPVSNDDPGSET
ncbi:MAG: NAD-dependent epimerase/dehydratase family protein [Candidatus Omnitrophota bacterium]